MDGSKADTFYQIKEGCWIMFSNNPKQNASDEKRKQYICTYAPSYYNVMLICSLLSLISYEYLCWDSRHLFTDP